MKRFVIRLFVFLTIMFVLDRGFGLAMRYMQEHAKGGSVGWRNYILDDSDEDVLIFGSSRALHHYNPRIIEDSLRLSCLNCGIEGMGMPTFYGWWKIIKERYNPQMIIYDLTPGYDLYVGEDNHKYLGYLKERYNCSGIPEIFDRIDKREKYKMMSYMYRYNSKFLEMIASYINPRTCVSKDGFLPIDKSFEKVAEGKTFNVSPVIDNLKASFIYSFIKECKYEDVQLIFCLSPIWYDQPIGNLDWMYEICNKNNIPLFDYSNNSKYIGNDLLFKDEAHLNSIGADEFTRDLVCRLKNDIRVN